MKYNRIIIAIVITSVLFLLLTFNNMGVKNNKEKVDCPKSIIKEEKIKTNSEIKKSENIVFLGDSITELYPIDDIYMDLPIVKSGTCGYKTQDILDRMESMVYQYNPTTIFLLIGTNDIMNNPDEHYEEAVENIEKIIELTKKHRKKVKIYVESIYPVNREAEKTMVKERNNEIIKRMNEKIQAYCNNSKNAEYIDIYNKLTDSDGNFDRKYSDDGLHPNDLGYARISKIRLSYIYDVKE